MSTSSAEAPRRPGRRGLAQRLRKVAALAAFALAVISPLAANPFLGGEAGAAPAPSVRSPSSQGPLVGPQLELRERTAAAIGSFASKRSAAALAAFLGAAFLYGLLHAAGPGHRKTVVFSLFLGRKAAPWEPLAAGFLSAGIHAGSGLVLVGLLGALRGAIASLGDTERIGSYLDGGTFGLLILASVILFVGKLRAILRKGERREGGSTVRGLYGTVAMSSVVPCPGATMPLLFALYAGHPWLGVAGVGAMSLGMGLVVSGSGYLAYIGREGLFRSLEAKKRMIGIVSDILELLSYLLILAFSLYTAWPFFTALFNQA